MSGLISYFLKHHIREKLPRLHRSLKDEFDARGISQDEAIILLAGIVRDPHEARKLMDKHQASSAPDLLARLPPPRVSGFVDRFQNWLRALEGAYESDPHSEDYRLSRRLYRD